MTLRRDPSLLTSMAQVAAVVDLTADDDDAVGMLPPPDRRAPKRRSTVGPEAGSSSAPVIIDDGPSQQQHAKPASDCHVAMPRAAGLGGGSPSKGGSRRPGGRQGAALARLPPWRNKHGTPRIVAELRALTYAVAAGQLPQLVESPTLPDPNNLFKWHMKLRGFDDSCSGGRRLNHDLRKLAQQHEQDHLLLEAAFPAIYPVEPFSLRIVTPRCIPSSGHITSGGAICLQALAPSGGPNNWRPDYCVESILNTAITNMLHCESLRVSGDILGGPLRLDWRFSKGVLSAFSEASARSTFSRAAYHHGWNAFVDSEACVPQQPLPQPAPQLVPQAAAAAARLVAQQQAQRPAQQPAQQPARPVQRPAQHSARAAQPAAAVVELDPDNSTVSRHAAPPAARQRAAVARQHALASAHASAAGLSSAAGVAGRSAGGNRLAGTPQASAASPASVDSEAHQQSRAAKRTRRQADTAAAHAVDIDLTDDVVLESLQQRVDDAEHAAHVAASQVMDLTSALDDDAPSTQRADAARAELAKAEAEKQALLRQIEEMRAEKEAVAAEKAAAAGLVLAPRPAQWTPPQDASALVEYVTLDMSATDDGADSGGDVDKEALELLLEQGACRADGVLALRHCRGDPDAALDFLVDCFATKVSAAERLATAEAEAEWAAAEKRREARDEVEAALKAVERCGGVPRSRVVQIVRVQNLRLWTKYIIRRNEVVELAGTAHSRESFLFHGSNSGVLELVTREGFDIRVSNLGGSLGAGTYFAEHISYSLAYVVRGMPVPGGQPPLMTAVAWADADVAQAARNAAVALQSYQQAQAALNAQQQSFRQQQAYRHQPHQPPVQQHQQGLPGPQLNTTWHPHPAYQQQYQQQLAQQQARQRQQLQAQQQQVATLLANAQQLQKKAQQNAAKAAAAMSPRRKKKSKDDSRQSSVVRPPGGNCTMMTLCRVTLGRIVPGSMNLRRPPSNADSTSGSAIYAVYDNFQAYPEYILWLTPQ